MGRGKQAGRNANQRACQCGGVLGCVEAACCVLAHCRPAILTHSSTPDQCCFATYICVHNRAIVHKLNSRVKVCPPCPGLPSRPSSQVQQMQQATSSLAAPPLGTASSGPSTPPPSTCVQATKHQADAKSQHKQCSSLTDWALLLEVHPLHHHGAVAAREHILAVQLCDGAGGTLPVNVRDEATALRDTKQAGER
jgi:hypothetical protein